MATSPLFGWEEPDDVDLVKDGAAAIRTLGNAIDTSMGDLLGGTTGQVLSKNSNTNMDFTWVTSDDANAIQNTIVDAKGDLIAASASDVPARLAVGADYTIVQALASTSTGLTYGGGWTNYTPAWTGDITNPVLGNGVISAQYRRIGGQVDFWIELTAGSTTTYGAGAYALGLPFNAIAGQFNFGILGNILNDGVAWYTNYYGSGVAAGVGNKFYLYSNAGAAWAPTVPFTFGTSDKVTVQGSYRVA